MKINPGTRLGKYTVDELIGSGGAGSVYRAIQEGPGGFNRPVAIKVLHGPLNAAKFERLAREARIIARLQQRNVVQVLELAHTPDLYFLVMELIEGLTLKQLQDRRKEPLPLSLTIHIGVEVCRALQYAHALTDEAGEPLGLVHRDIKPSNILISTQGDVKLSDFGIAKRLLVAADQYTSHGIIKGTPAYMSPEQREGLPATAASDVYALCKILYELAIGRWLGTIDGPPSFGKLSGTMIGSGFDAVISQGLNDDPVERPTTRALASELRALLPEVTPSEQLPDLGEVLALCVKQTRRKGIEQTLPPPGRAPIRQLETRPMTSDTTAGETVPNRAAPNRPVVSLPQAKKTQLGVGPASNPNLELPATAARPPLQQQRLIATADGITQRAGLATDTEIDEDAETIPSASLPAAATTTEIVSPTRMLIAFGLLVGALVLVVVVWLWPEQRPARGPSSDRPMQKLSAVPRLDAAVLPAPVEPAATERVHDTVELKTTKPDVGVQRQPMHRPRRPDGVVHHRIRRAPAKGSRARPKPEPTSHDPQRVSQKMGALSINTVPWSTVFVDGKKLGTTPLYRVPIAEGKRLLVLTSKDGRSMKRHVTIVGEKHSNLGLLEFDQQ